MSTHPGEIELMLICRLRLEIQDVKDDGNDPLRHKISHACDFIEQAGKSGGKTLIHCVG